MKTQTEIHKEFKKELRQVFKFVRVRDYLHLTVGIYPKRNKDRALFTLKEVEEIYLYFLKNNIQGRSIFSEEKFKEIAGNGKRLILNLYADGFVGVYK